MTYMFEKPETTKGSNRSMKGLLTAVIAGLCMLVIHHLFVYITALGTSYSLFNPADYVRFDSYLYLDIAGKGYELFPCWQRFEVYPVGSPDWCGNAGWMPLYPALIKLLVLLGMQDYLAAWVLSRLFQLTAYTFIYLLVPKTNRTGLFASLILAAIFPASIYYDAAFPISLMLALYTGSFYLWNKGMTLPAGILAFGIPLAYSTGFVSLLPWLLFSFLLFRAGDPRFKGAFLMAISVAAGYASFFVFQKISLGVWNGFFLVQAKYGHGLHNILPPLRDMLKSIWLSGLNHNWQNIQSLVCLALLIPVFRIREKDAQTLFFKLSFGAFLLFPLLVGSDQLSLYRSESLLLPAVILLAHKPRAALILIPVFVYLLYNCTLDFFSWKIV